MSDLTRMKSQDTIKIATSGTLNLGGNAVINILLQVMFTAILARLLTPKDYGVVTATRVLIAFAEMFWAIGVAPAIVQKKNLTSEDISTARFITSILGASTTILVFLLSPVMVKIISIENAAYVRVLSLVFLINSVSIISNALLQREFQFKKIATVNVVSYFFGLGVVGIVLAWLGLGAWSLIYAQLAQALINSTFTIIIRPIKEKPRIYKDSIRPLLNYGTGITIAKLFNYFALQGDNIVIARTMGVSSLGIYGRAYDMLQLPAMLVGKVLDKVLFPIMSKMQDEKVKLQKTYIFALTTIGNVMFPLTALLLNVIEEVTVIFLGKQWVNVAPILGVFVFGFYYRTSYKISDSLCRSLGAVYRRAVLQGIYAILVIAGAYIGHFYGLRGVAVGTTIAILFNYWFMLILSKRLIGFSFYHYIRHLLPTALISAIMYVILAITKKLILILISVDLITIFVLGIISISIYIVFALYVLKFIYDDEYIRYAKRVLNIFTEKLKRSRKKVIKVNT